MRKKSQLMRYKICKNLQKSAKKIKICTKSMWLSGQLLIKNKQFLLFFNFVLQINRVIQVKSNIFLNLSY